MLNNVHINLECVSPIIALIPSASSSVPTQFQRSQDFSIVSIIELNCNISLSINTKWTINKCINSTCVSQIHVDQSVVTTFSELFIPARSLNYGIYEFKLTVTMIAVPNLTTSALTYVKITQSSIQANLIQFDTSMITQGDQQNFILDPGTFSIDPDTTMFNASVS